MTKTAKVSIFIIIFIISHVFIAFSNDTTRYAFKKIQNDLFQKNLDSLLKLSYVQKSLKAYPVKKQNNASVNFPDSVYHQRFDSLSSYIRVVYNPKVKQFITLYTQKSNRKKTEIMLGLSAHYAPLFEQTLREYLLPVELKYLPMALSGYHPQAVSENGAAGLWQLMYTIARRYGLHITSFSDERRNTQKATEAAARYLKDMYDLYSDWTLALAAYTCGAANVNKAISRSGGKHDFWEIYRFLPQKSRENIPAFYALLYLNKFYAKHKLSPRKIDMPQNIATLRVKKKIHLGQIAAVLNVPQRDLQDLNPEYRKQIIQPVSDKDILNIPQKYAAQFKAMQDSIAKYKVEDYFKPPKPIVKPTKVAARKHNVSNSRNRNRNTNYTPVVPKNSVKIYYTVKSGDSMGLIAQWYSVSTSQLRNWNNKYNNRIYPGNKLAVYVPKNKLASYIKVNIMSFDQKQAFIGKGSKTSSRSSDDDEKYSGKRGGFVYYTIQSGDNLWSIAQRYPDVTVQDIIKINRFPKNYKLYPGQRIKIKLK